MTTKNLLGIIIGAVLATLATNWTLSDPEINQGFAVIVVGAAIFSCGMAGYFISSVIQPTQKPIVTNRPAFVYKNVTGYLLLLTLVCTILATIIYSIFGFSFQLALVVIIPLLLALGSTTNV